MTSKIPFIGWFKFGQSYVMGRHSSTILHNLNLIWKKFDIDFVYLVYFCYIGWLTNLRNDTNEW